MSKRDTQFAGFAKTLFEEIHNKCDELNTDLDIADGCVMCNLYQEKLNDLLSPIIARRAYDLVEYVLSEQIAIGNIEQGSLEYVMDIVPDMTTWPEEGKG